MVNKREFILNISMIKFISQYIRWAIWYESRWACLVALTQQVCPLFTRPFWNGPNLNESPIRAQWLRRRWLSSLIIKQMIAIKPRSWSLYKLSLRQVERQCRWRHYAPGATKKWTAPGAASMRTACRRHRPIDDTDDWRRLTTTTTNVKFAISNKLLASWWRLKVDDRRAVVSLPWTATAAMCCFFFVCARLMCIQVGLRCCCLMPSWSGRKEKQIWKKAESKRAKRKI